MLFNPFSLCYGRFEKEEVKQFNTLLSETKNMNLKNNSNNQVPIHISEETKMFLESRPKITKPLNMINPDHDLNFNIRGTGHYTRKPAQIEKSNEGFNFKNGTFTGKISTIPPLNLQNIDIIMERLNEIESLVKKLIDKYQVLESAQNKQMDEVISEKIKELLFPLLSSSSESIDDKSIKSEDIVISENLKKSLDLTAKDSVENHNSDREFINCLGDSHQHTLVSTTDAYRESLVEIDSARDWTAIPAIECRSDSYHILGVEKEYYKKSEVLELPAIKSNGDLKWGDSMDDKYPLEIADEIGDEIIIKSRSMPSIDFTNKLTMSVSMKSLNTLSNLSELGSIE